MPAGLFITFEGLDGSGKSTQWRLLRDRLAAQGYPVTATRQPGGTRIGDSIRALLLDSRRESPSPHTELALMFADRAQAVGEVIRPALEDGHIVLCDRFTDSTEAYQGGGRGLGSRLVLELHKLLCGGLQPDLTLLLLPDFESSLARARRRNERASGSTGRDESRFEAEDSAFFRRVFEAYREIARREPGRVAEFGEGSIDEIHRRIAETVEERLAARG